MVTEADLIKDVRLELGDLVEPFRDTYRGNDSQREWNLSAQNILSSSVVARHTTFEDPPVEKTYTSGEYTVNSARGSIKFTTAPPQDALVVVEGNSYGIFSDEELGKFVEAALYQHLNGRSQQVRYRDGRGFIKYERQALGVEHLPDQEKLLVTLLATIESLWALSTDAALDIDVQTSEGTSLPRGQRWRQLQSQIDLLTQKYMDLSLMLGVGLYAPEVFSMRRVSRSTGRLVPIFQPREYDETGPAIRKVVPINTKSSDPDGPESPLYASWGH